ncbi:MAG: hypothetical protein J0L97_01465 [Alphaproteobacteria bacterium]|nr:hypothetical protein [Alphaproteobacteria bacterium]
MKPQLHTKALLTLLDTAYQEIRGLELARGVTISADDLRPRIEGYHDIIRAWSAEGKKKAPNPLLTVTHIAAALAHLRAEADQAYAGIATFFPTTSWKDAQSTKRSLLLNPAALAGVPELLLAEDIHAFILWAKTQPPEQLAEAFAERDIVAPPRGMLLESQWKALPPKTLLPKLETALARKSADLRDAWLRIRHPLALAHEAVSGGTGKYWFEPSRHIPEADWPHLPDEARMLAKLYEKYALLFAAATAEPVDRDYKDKKEEMDGTVADIALLIEIAQEMSGQKFDEAMIDDLAAYCESDKGYEEILAVLLHRLAQERKKKQDALTMGAVVQSLEGLNKTVEGQAANLEQAHFSFLSNQLSVYEASKDLVKKLAQQGLNLAGRFVQSETTRTTGRGPGAGRDR